MSILCYLAASQTDVADPPRCSKFCLDHRTETAHQCAKAGEWARRRAQANQQSSRTSAPTQKTNILTHEQQCAEVSCKTLINTPLVTGVLCDKCNRSYCLKHRFGYDHDCDNLKPLGARTASSTQTQKEKGLAALGKLRAWGQAKKDAAPKMPKMPQSKAKQSAAAEAKQIADLKRTAKGDDKIPVEKRIYLFVEASSETVTSKVPKGKFFYSADYSVGRMLDLAAKGLSVSNVNNRSEGEEMRLRVFHVEGGRLLEFGEKVGGVCQTGNTVVLLRGVGEKMAPAPSAS